MNDTIRDIRFSTKSLSVWCEMKERDRYKHAATECKESLLLEDYGALKSLKSILLS